MDQAISDHNMRLILLSVIQLGGGHCTERISTVLCLKVIFFSVGVLGSFNETAQSEDEERIVNGIPAYDGQFPYQVPCKPLNI